MGMTGLLRFLPGSFRRSLRKFATRSRLETLYKQWVVSRDSEVSRVRDSNAPLNVLLVPCDPWTVYGSIGDQAMIFASLDAVAKSSPSAKIFVLTASETGDDVARKLGASPCRLWDANPFIGSISKFICNEKIDSVFVLGADVLDGYYNPLVAAKLLVVADTAARLGCLSSILGFSFNKNPNALLRRFFDGMHRGVNINIRDPLSYERYKAFSSRGANLVADSAFMLNQDASGNEYVELNEWVSAQRKSGAIVLGLNVHPLLLAVDALASTELLVNSVCQAVESVSKARNISWVLVAHDYRERVGDVAMLKEIQNRLSGRIDSCYYVPGVNSAAQLKAFASLLDGVVTGRMHLAIASLGSGVPVLALTYQDKFEGLFEHFDLPDWLLVSQSLFLTPELLAERITDFCDHMDEIKIKIDQSLFDVKKLSKINFQNF